MADPMVFASACATTTVAEDAAGLARDAAASACARLGMPEADLALVFISSHFAREARAICQQVQENLPAAVLIGCTAEGVISDTDEMENTPAIALIAARLPRATLVPFALEARSLSEWNTMMSSAGMFHDLLGAPRDPRAFILFADPFSTPVTSAPNSNNMGLLEAFNAYYEGVPVIGGIASGGQFPGSNALIYNDHVLGHGVVGVAICGPVELDVIVSQGCRPIGQPMRVTHCTQNRIITLEGRPPIEVIQELVDQLPERDQALMRQGLYIGRAIHLKARDAQFGRGDFLVRGVLGGDQHTGAILIGDVPEEGEWVQFHVRDAATAEEDLEMMLAPQLFYDPPAGGLLFLCNGRGTHLFDHPNGDVDIIQDAIGGDAPVPLAGFFCGGEFGPVGNRNFLHGHTALLVLFRPAA
jgi:small ligand-binding sensory domain FIST